MKRFVFEFLDCYLHLFYVAFYKLDIIALRKELISLYMVDEIRRIVTETLIPYLSRCGERRSIRKQRTLT
jgi:anoctamin-10